jgi:uncharacterized protein YbjT (DUF2867 family)
MGPTAGRSVFITGATGYLGRPLVQVLIERGHSVRALVRASSASRLPPGAEPVVGDALVAASYASEVRPGDVFVHLVGVAHPSPSKSDQFRSVDLASIQAAAANAKRAGAARFIYVSVAQPAPVLKEYVLARAAGEETLRRTGMPAVILRPWYVLGPGHRWPYLLFPLYGIAWLFPKSRAAARRLGLVHRPQMIRALVRAVESDGVGVEVVDVAAIRSAVLT